MIPSETLDTKVAFAEAMDCLQGIVLCIEGLVMNIRMYRVADGKLCLSVVVVFECSLNGNG